MNWNNDKLNEIQAIEDELILLGGRVKESTVTGFIHKSKQWTQIKPLKQQKDEQINQSSI